MMKHLISLALVISLASCARYANNFGHHEWKMNLLQEPVDLRPIDGQTSWVLLKNGFNFVSELGTTDDGKKIDWKTYRFSEGGANVQFLTKDNQIQEFQIGGGDFVRNIPVNEGSDIHDFFDSNDGLTVIREDKIEVQPVKGKAYSIEVEGGNIIDAVLSTGLEGTILYTIEQNVCTASVSFSNDDDKIELNQDNCLEFEGNVEVYSKNQNGFLIKSNSNLVAINTDNNVVIGKVNDQVVTRGSYVGVVSSLSTTELKIVDLSDLSEPTTVTLKNHCVLANLHLGDSETGIPVACHDYSSEKWNRIGTGLSEVSVTLHTSDSDSTEYKKFSLSKLGVFRYIQEFWVDTSTNTILAAVFDDLSLRLFNKNGEQIKKFESGLTLVTSVLAEDFNDKSTLESDPMNQYLAMKNIPIQGFMWRLLQDVNNFKNGIIGLLSKFSSGSMNFEDIKQAVLNPGHVVDPEFLNEYGLRKRIILSTEGNVVYCLDSLNGNIMWSHNLKPYQSLLRVLKGAEPGTVEYHFTQVKDSKSATFSQIISVENGVGIGGENLLYFKGESKVYKIPGEGNKRIELDYAAQKLYSTAEKKVFTFKVDNSGVSGYNIHNVQFNEIWNIKFSANEQLVDYSYHLKDYNQHFEAVDQGFYVQIPEKGSLIYKIVDSHNLAVVTKTVDSNNKEKLNVYLINGKRGKIMAKYQNFDVDFSKSINLVYDDNGIFVSYFNKKTFNTEIWVFEILKNEIESDFMQVIKKFVTKSVEVKPINYSNVEEDYILLERKYGVHFGIKKLRPLTTKNGLAKRNLIAITDNNDLYSIDRLLLSARRLDFIDGKPPVNRIGSEIFMSDSLPPYSYYIPYDDKNILNAAMSFNDLKDITVLVTDFESTSLVIGYGSEIFLTRVSPNGEFDILSGDFNHNLLALFVVAILGGCYYLKKLSEKKQAKAKFYVD